MRTRVAGDRCPCGWELPHPGWSGGDHCSADTVGHTGFTGTGLWIDFAHGLAWTLLTNRVHPSRHFDSGIFALRIRPPAISSTAPRSDRMSDFMASTAPAELDETFLDRGDDDAGSTASICISWSAEDFAARFPDGAGVSAPSIC